MHARGVGLLGPIVVLFFRFFRNLHTVFPPTVYKGSLFFTSPLTFVICRLFDDSHSDRCNVISHCDFDTHFSDD